jgi:acetoin utilization deacetylase AcuC-like enzyme
MSRLRAAVLEWTGHPVRVWHHPSFRVPIAGAETRLGIEPRRADHVLTWLLDAGVIPDESVAEAPQAPWEALLRVHDADYLASLDRPEVLAPIVAVDPRVVATAPLIEMWRRAAGAVSEAMWWACRHRGRAAVLSGGFHHAHPAHGAGFCGLNDVAVAVRDARMRGVEGRIAVLDFDAHPPDGIAACLAGEPRVHIASLGVASDWALPDGVDDHRVPAGSGDGAYLAAVDRLLTGLPSFDLAVVLCGADPLDGDRMGALACTEAGLAERERRVLARIGDRPAVLLPAGGYTREAWRVFANAIAIARGSRARPPEGYNPLIRRTRRVAQMLDPGALGNDEELLTAEDIAEAFGFPHHEPRFLRHYTRQGIEYALNRYGLLDAIHRMGFEGLAVEIRATHWPHVVRVTAEVAGRREILLEEALSFREVLGLRTVFVDWLTLRDPRVPFPPDRPRLPGQEAPGLGMASDAMVLLREVARRLDLDAVSMVPSHYHVAWMVRNVFRFADPELQGRFRALSHHLRGLPLHRASELLDGPGVPAEYGDNLRWIPEIMLYPLSERARAACTDQDKRVLKAEKIALDAMLPVA